MRFLVKANKLFLGLTSVRSYHQALAVEDDERSSLLAARREIRAALRTAASQIRTDPTYWQDSFARRQASTRPEIEPKFFTQGSFAYDLLVAPCQKPPQQLDLDDGMYVSVEYLENGEPALVARALFSFVEQALAPLCASKGWRLDRSKRTCVRVIIALDRHVDIPIYSAPAELTASMSFIEDALMKGRFEVRGATTYIKLPADKIMLAHRNGGWQQSDPLRLHDWVEGCAEFYGPGFRRACRYFKGWRDFRWAGCGLSSITIMAAVADALERLNGEHRQWDDDRLIFEVSQLLPEILQTELYNPAFPDQKIVLNDWSNDERTEIIEAAAALAGHLHDALCGTYNRDLVVNRLRNAFGNRVPNRPDVIEVLQSPVAAVVAEKAAKVAAPKVVKSTSG